MGTVHEVKWIPNDHEHEMHVPNPAAEEEHSHAFVLVGTETFFLCHQTNLWWGGHTYQVVLRVRLDEGSMEALSADRSKNYESPPYIDFPSTYFLANEGTGKNRFAIPKLQTGQVRSFIGTIYRGIPQTKEPVYTHWPWSGEQGIPTAKPIITDAEVTVERVVYFRHFDYNMDYPFSQTYVLFGFDNEAHLYHYQTKEPDFDQVASLVVAPEWLHQIKLQAGVHINVPSLPMVTPCCTDPLAPPRELSVRYQGTSSTRPIQVDRTVWFSNKISNKKNPCQSGSAI